MSSRDRRSARLIGLLTLTAGLLLTSCSSGAHSSSAAASRSAAVAADPQTRQLAQVEFDRQCAMNSLSFPSESAITADLDDRLKAAGLAHLEWKHWHDALVSSPQLVAQFRQISGAGCPKA